MFDRGSGVNPATRTIFIRVGRAYPAILEKSG
jgi:hypothetical protein